MKNVCIVGYGAIGPVHAEALEKTNSAEFYAVCDINEEKIRICREKYDVIAYSDFSEMLKDENIDSVHICTPHYLHFEMIKKAVESGKSVVCEKPVVMTEAEFEELEKFAADGKIGVVLQNRLNPCFLRLKEIIEKGDYGKVKAVKGIMTWERTMQYYSQGDWRGKTESEGGGVLINQAVHTLDYLCSIAGKADCVKANTVNFSLPEIEVEDTCTAYIKFESGVRGLFFASNSNGANSSVDFEVVFEDGTIARYTDEKLFIDRKIIEEDTRPLYEKAYWGAGHEKLIKSFYDLGQYFSPDDVKNTMKTMFAIYKSARCGGEEIFLG